MTRRISGPGGSNEYRNAIDSAGFSTEGTTGVEATGSFPSNPRRVGHTIRSISGPKNSGLNELEYKGT